MTRTAKEATLLAARRFLISCGILVLVFGCGKPRQASNSAGDLHPDIKSTADLKRRLVPGMTTNEIFAQFGKPTSARHLENGRTEWRYGLSGFPADDDMRGTYVVAVNVITTNGHLDRWACTYMEPPDVGDPRALPIGESNPGPQGGQRESPMLKFFLVNEEPIPGGKQIDTAQFPNLGYISADPDLAVKRLESLTLEERTVHEPGGNGTNWQFGINLTPEDAKGLASITASSLGKKLLITVGDVPVLAPMVMVPLETGNLVLKVGDASLMQTVKSNLARMERIQ